MAKCVLEKTKFLEDKTEKHDIKKALKTWDLKTNVYKLGVYKDCFQ